MPADVPRLSDYTLPGKREVVVVALIVFAESAVSLWGTAFHGWSLLQVALLVWLQTVIAAVFSQLRVNVTPHHGVDDKTTSVIVIAGLLFAALVGILFSSLRADFLVTEITSVVHAYILSLGITLALQLYGFVTYVRSDRRQHISRLGAQGSLPVRILILGILGWALVFFSLFGSTVALVVFLVGNMFATFSARVLEHMHLAKKV